MRSLVQRTALALAAVVGLLGTRPATANAQKALVYCPVAVDATGCNAIVTALTGPAYPLGVDRGYDGTNGTVDLKAVDLFSYSVFVVPSLADDATSQPYALLRDPEVVEHLKAALIGRLAMWSGSPDQGGTNRAMKDALIQNLAGWAGGAYATAKGPGLVALLDASASATSRYDWVRAITPVAVTSDPNLLIYSSVRSLDQRANAILTSGAGMIAYDNMATFGFQVPNGAPGVSLDAVGQTGTTQGGQVVLLTMEAGNASGALVKTDKDDYPPGMTVVITGSGWGPNETVKLSLHMDPLRDADTELTATADGSGNFTNTDFAPSDYDVGVRFVLTALGQTSGRRAQTTFTDGKSTITGTVRSTATGNPPIAGATVTCLIADGCNQNETTTTNASGVYSFEVNYGGNSANLTIRASATGFTSGSAVVAVSNGNTTSQNFLLSPASTAPTAVNDAYSTNEDQPLTVSAPGVLGNDLGAGPLTAVIGTTPPASEGTVSLNANGGFTFNPAADFNGTTSFTYRAQNGGGLSAPATVTITVNAVNDAPTFTLIASHASNEDAGAQTVSNALTARSAGPANESGQTLMLTVTNDNNALFTSQPAIDGSGTLTYTAAPNAYGSATVSVTLQDNGGTANGGVDQTTKTLTITVNAVNDAPSFTKGADQTLLEDAGAQTVVGWATAISAGPNETQVLTFQVSSNNPALFSAAPSVSAAGTLTYTPAPNANGNATVTISLKDDGGTLNGGVDQSANQTFTITVGAVNDAPTFTKGADQTVLEDAGAQTVPGWATGVSAGAADEEGQVLTFNVTNNTNSALFSTQPAIDPATGTLTYTPAANAYGSATITITLSDNGGTANSGLDTSAPQTFTINVTPVNDAPSFTKGADQTVNEDAGPQSVNGWATAISAGPNEASQLVDFVVSNTNNALFSAQPAVDASGNLTFTPAPNANGSATVTIHIHDNGGTANSGVDASANQTFTITVNAVNDAPSFVKGADQTVNEDAGPQTVTPWATAISAGPADESSQTLAFLVSNDNNALFSAQPAIDASGNLTYTPAANAFGTTTVTVALKDNGGTANGGSDQSASQTFTITVNAVNDAPSFTKGADQTVLEDAPAQSISGWATAISAGPANESSQTVTFEITGNTNPGLFAVAPAVSSTGTLTYTLAADAFGSATITLRAKDNGGTANGGIDTSPTQMFDINVTSVNDAPTFGLIASHTVLEDAGAQSVSGALTSPSAGPPNESGQILSLTVTNDNNGLFSAQPSIDLATGTLTYTPAANANGSATVTVTLMDNGGTANGGVDKTIKTLTITVTAVNDAPSFTKGANQASNEDAGAQTANGWATAISAGPTDEAGQALNFIVTNDNNALFSSQPAVDASGKLTYTAAANANGTATVTIKLHDDGGIANGGQDTSGEQTFTITVNPVNDVPTFVKGADQTVNEDAGLQTVTNWATAISKGPADENGQTLTFSVTNNTNAALFSAGPTVDPATGTLTYTPAADAYGTATITLRLMDNGGTANGGVDFSEQTFTITVTPVNDAPSFTKGADQTVLEDAAAQSIAGWATAISAGPANESSQTLTFEVTGNTNPSLFSVAPAVDATGKLTYTVAANANGNATITLQLKDNGGTTNGGVDTSPTQMFDINVTPVNDAPTYDLITSTSSAEDAGPQTLTNALTNKSVGPSNESSQSFLPIVVTNNNNALFSAQPSIDLTTGTLTYTAAPNANGLATVTVTVKDDGGTANGGVNATAKTFTITITKVNDVPVINAFSGPLLPVSVNTSVSATGNFTDVDLGDSPPDVLAATINWGDGNAATTATISGSGTTRSLSGSHTYTTPGVYTLTLIVSDAAGAADTATYQYVVIYDPNGGFVTGGGWINSPASAYVPDPSLTGKATFGFVSKYKKGQSAPDGSTEFQFHAAGMNFKSSVYEWLVVAGAKAQFKGSGTINGQGNYGFILSAIDGQVNGGGGADKFRIKIWDKNNADAVVYDNQLLSADTADPTTLLGGGSINIQAK